MFQNKLHPLTTTDDNKSTDDSVLSLLLSFSSSSLTSSSGSPDFSCENLTPSFFSPSSLSMFDYNDEHVHPSPETILFFEILQDFPDLKNFVCHHDFMMFATLWLGYKYKTMLARKVSHRQIIMDWFKTAATQIHYQLIHIAKSGCRTDPEALGMFSAFRRLKDRIEIVQQVLNIIENGRILFRQTPLEAVAPLSKLAIDIHKQVASFAENPHIAPFEKEGRLELRPVHQVTMHELSSRILQTYQIPCRDIQPHLLHSWSLPTTPCIEFSVTQEPFFSLPTSPKNSTALSDESDISSIHSSQEDDDYVVSDEEEEKIVVKRKRLSKKSPIKKSRSERHYTRRTATSYDAKTTHYLKTIFFDIYSHRKKLTKEQRRQIQKKTGLKPRNITYWFSNHKRRFQNSLAVFKQVVEDSKGQVKTYDDFLNWRKEQGLPEEILDDEVQNR